ncbi:S8 family peptidase [Pedobacter sp. MC2016-14]|uniref:S8 family serine peptidase n=1 Tax=Pedobacter sp. MC2016-14 TaxID=2897327 RepID=UPI001E571842|nr:S8 family serine peptidase [Pedobacter sp. MC2016-14]MCD0486741.1 S8 family peptidase [Pedobacter sp. MC2016-14]
MTKSSFLKYTLPFFTAWIGLTAGLNAQVNNPRVTNTAFLEKNGIELREKSTAQRTVALARAKEKGWPVSIRRQNGRILVLQRIDALGLPIYYATDNNALSAITTGTNTLYTGGSLGLSLSGSSLTGTKAALWDGGAVLTNHIEFGTGRVEIKDNTTATSTHSTHVAGTMIASGINAAARGMAYALPKLSSFDFTNDNAEMSANAATLLISNHSYGVIAGWDLNTDVSPQRWEFYGRAGANEDYKFGYYDDDAAAWDRICYNAPYYLPVKSAGNNRSVNGPAVGATYYRYNTAGTFINAGPRPTGISSNNGYDIISTSGNAKNILTVGAIGPLSGGPASASTAAITSFSSWGPTDDGRIKPDLVGNGSNVTSTSDASVNAYITYSGTSMAAPNVSGSLLLLQELYSQKNNGAFMRAATLKGLAIGTAADAGNAGPDYIYGWGLLNMQEAATLILDNGTKSRMTENALAQGQSQDLVVIASGNGPLKATISWTDPAANPVTTENALNNPIARLVNDLDLRVIQGSSTFTPWILNPASPSTAATKGDNFRDNVEQVLIADAVPGRSYTIRVSHKGTLQSGPQAYSLILSGIGGSNYCSSAPTSSADSKITNFSLSNINNTTATGCSTYSDFSSMSINLEKGVSYPLSLSLGTCGNNFNKVAKIYADWNGDGDFTDAGELIGTSTVISAAGTYTTTITVPGNVNPEHYSLLRVVLVETSDAGTVNPCGNYAKGETQDYRIKFLTPAVDPGIKAIVDPTATLCANTAQTVKVTLKNYGAQAVSNLPVMVVVRENTTIVATLIGTFTGTLASMAESSFLLPGSFNAEAGKSYSITASITQAGDADAGNNQLSTNVQVNMPPIVSADSKAYFCNSFNSYALTSSGQGTVYWYKTANATVPFAYGSAVTTMEAPENNTYYAGLNDYRSEAGPKTKATFPSGNYNSFDPAVLVTTLAPVVIESARLYIGNSGRIKFSVINGLGVEVSSNTLSVTATRTTPAAGESTNDANDQGQVYPLNLTFPTAGNYTITLEYFDGATIFRNYPVTTQYPYASALDLLKITGNTAATNSGAYYYYFYDIKVKSTGCSSTEKIAVPLTSSTITNINGELSVSGTGTYQWYLNGVLITGATAKTYKPLQNGKYTVDVTVSGGCVLRSGEYTYTNISTNAGELDINLKAYPVPTDGELNLNFSIPVEGDFTIVLSNMMGQQVFKESRANYLGFFSTRIKMNHLTNGVYILTVRSGNKKFSRKVTLIK